MENSNPPVTTSILVANVIENDYELCALENNSVFQIEYLNEELVVADNVIIDIESPNLELTNKGKNIKHLQNNFRK